MSITLEAPDGPWTIADVDRLPDAGFRYEIHEGDLVIMSPATLWHTNIGRRIANALERLGRFVGLEVGVRRSDRSTRTADVAVFRAVPTDEDRAFWAPDELELVIEIVSPESVERDRVDKPHWYANCGIPEYWLVEKAGSGEAAIIQHSLVHTVNGTSAYVQTGVTTLSALEAEAAKEVAAKEVAKDR